MKNSIAKKILLLLFLLIPCISFAKTVTRIDGKKVILKEDGTWEYAKKKKKLIEEKEACKEKIAVSVSQRTKTIPADISTVRRFKDTITVSGNAGEQITVVLLETNKSLFLLFQVAGDDICFKHCGNIQLFLSDGTIFKFRNDLPNNCDGKFGIGFLDSYWRKKKLEKLAANGIEKIGLKTRKQVIEAGLSQENNNTFREGIDCLWIK